MESAGTLYSGVDIDCLNDLDIDLDNIPDFNCLCELCDCGCFEKTRQPHSLNCKKYLNKFDNRSKEEWTTTNASTYKAPVIQSEYRVKYRNADRSLRQIQPKLKDTFSLDKRQLLKLPDTLPKEELNKDSFSDINNTSYNTDFNYYGKDEVGKMPETMIDSFTESFKGARKHFDGLNYYKVNYLKMFNEANSGFVDNYSLTKGGALLQINEKNRQETLLNESKQAKNDSFSSVSVSSHCNGNTIYDKFLPKRLKNIPARREPEFNTEEELKDYIEFKSYEDAKRIRDSEMRSVFIPKKFSGRNLFASHIDSTIFPEKHERMYETQYSKSFDSSALLRSDNARYGAENAERSIRYSMTHDNKLMPRLNVKPAREILDNFEKNYSNDKTNSSCDGLTPLKRTSANRNDLKFSKSSYQNDFEDPSKSLVSNALAAASASSSSMNKTNGFKPVNNFNNSPNEKVCKAFALKKLMLKNKSLALKYNQEPNQTISNINKRLQQIDKILIG